MPPVVVVAPTVCRFTLKHTVSGGRPCYCSVDVSIDEFGSTRHAAIASTATGVRNAWQSNMVPQANVGTTFTGISWVDLDSEDGETGSLSPDGARPLVGMQSGAQTPPNVSGLIKKRVSSARGTRSGRMYWPPLSEGGVDDAANLASGTRTNLETAAGAFNTAIQAIGVGIVGTVAWRVVHVVGHGPPEPGYPNGKPNEWSSSDITSITVDSKVATQRRRVRK